MNQEGVITVSIDGMDYTVDVTNFTGREVGILKSVGHIKGFADFGDAMLAGDLEVLAALAGIAMKRAGHEPDFEKLLDMPLGKIVVSAPDEPDPTPAPQADCGATPAPSGTPSTPDSMA